MRVYAFVGWQLDPALSGFGFSDIASPAQDLEDLIEFTAVLPEDRAVLPEGRAVLLEERAVLPEDRAVLLKGRAVLPEERAVLLKGRAVLPEDRAVLLKGRALLLEDRAVLLEGRALLPEDRAVLLKGRALLLEDRAVLLEGRALLPEERAVLPEERAVLLEDRAVLLEDPVLRLQGAEDIRVCTLLPLLHFVQALIVLLERAADIDASEIQLPEDSHILVQLVPISDWPLGLPHAVNCSTWPVIQLTRYGKPGSWRATSTMRARRWRRRRCRLT